MKKFIFLLLVTFLISSCGTISAAPTTTARKHQTFAVKAKSKSPRTKKNKRVKTKKYKCRSHRGWGL